MLEQPVKLLVLERLVTFSKNLKDRVNQQVLGKSLNN